MDISDANFEWENLSNQRREEILIKIIKALSSRDALDDPIIDNFLYDLIELENEDFFGTEGLQV